MIKVPKTIEAAEQQLASLDGLITAKQWDRAAIVWAFTYEGTNRWDSGTELNRYNVTQFAERGIKGLASKTSVIAYRKAWRDAMQMVGAPDVQPGDSLEAPALPFPPVSLDDPRYKGIDDKDAIKEQAETDGTGASKALDIAKNLKAMAAAIKASPKVAAAAEAAITDAAKGRLDKSHPVVQSVEPDLAEQVWGIVTDVQRLERDADKLARDLHADLPRVTNQVSDLVRGATQKTRSVLDFVDALVTEGGLQIADIETYLSESEDR
jgi:hypothetical protein